MLRQSPDTQGIQCEACLLLFSQFLSAIVFIAPIVSMIHAHAEPISEPSEGSSGGVKFDVTFGKLVKSLERGSFVPGSHRALLVSFL